MSKKLKSDLMLLLTAFIWGSAFIAQSKGADLLGPFTFNGIRYSMAVISLLIVIFISSKSKKHKEEEASFTTEEKAARKKYLIMGGLATGCVLFVSTNLQQYAMAFTTAAKAGFITTLYVILVPIVGIFLKKKVRPMIWFCAILAVVGLYLLSIKPGTFSISRGDFFVLLCAFGFTAHILVIDHFAPKVDGVKLSCFQFSVVAVFCFIAMGFTETLVLTDVWKAMLPLLYAGVLSSAVAYTLQIIAQQDADPTICSLLLSLESVFAAICGAIVLGEVMTFREIMGCVVMFAAIIIAQLPSKEERLKVKN